MNKIFSTIIASIILIFAVVYIASFSTYSDEEQGLHYKSDGIYLDTNTDKRLIKSYASINNNHIIGDKFDYEDIHNTLIASLNKNKDILSIPVNTIKLDTRNNIKIKSFFD